MALADLYGKILAIGIQTIRNQTSLPALVNSITVESTATPHGRGGNVEVIIPPEFATRDVIPGPVPPASGAAPAPSTVQVPLNYWKEVSFPLTEKDIQLMENSDAYIPMFLANAAAALADDISASIFAQYTGVYGFVGTAGTTPFSASPVQAQDAKKTLTRQKCPKFMRQMVLDPDAYGNATGLQAFRSALEYGSNQTVLEGEITRAYGFDWHEDVAVPTHTNPSGTPINWTVSGAVATGATSATIAGGTNAPIVGDVFTVAGGTQTHVVTSYVAGVITFSPKVTRTGGWANASALTFKAAHVVNLAFHPMALAFVSRPEATPVFPELKQGKVLATWVDEQTGVVLRLEIKDEYHQTGFYISCLWGTKLIDGRLIARVAG